MEAPKRLFLLDAYALIFRAYYALIKMPRITSSGFNTSAIFGFVNTLEELLKKERPTHMAVCFDPAGPTFRNEAFEQYKGEREATPEDLKRSVPIIKEIVKAYNIPLLEVEGFEADDVIGTMSKKASAEGFTTYMMTPDKDFGQLVNPNVLQYKPSYRGQDFELRGEAEVCERYGIKSTSQVIDLLALMGDKVDNIPGCPGVGEKTAVKLIGEFESVENLLENTDKLKGALKKKIEENAEQIKFSKFLATIRTDVPVEVQPDELKVIAPNTSKLFAIFDELEFRTLKNRVEKRISSERQPAKSDTLMGSLFADEDFGNVADDVQITEASNINVSNFKRVLSSKTIEAISERLVAAEKCSLVLFSEGENDMDAEWIGTAVALNGEDAWFLANDFPGAKAFVLDLMARNDIKKICVASKRDYVLAARERKDDGEALSNFYDISLAHYLLQPEMRHEPEILSSQYVSLKLPELPVITSAVGVKKRMSLVQIYMAAPDKFSEWGCAQAVAALTLYPVLEKEIEMEGMKNLLEDVEFPLSRVLAEMELTGVRIDKEALDQAALHMKSRIEKLEQEIFEMAGCEFNVGSPAKVGEVLFDKLNIEPKPKKTKTGQYSTGEEVLEKIAVKYPIAEKILHYRQLKKLLNTYLIALPASINPATGRIHTNYNQTVTATGRISSSNPNLQNIPVRDEDGREIRKAFIVGKNQLFLSADYSQIELRLVADFASDQTMLDAFAHDKDIHSATAAKIYHKSPEEVSGTERRNAKTANFGILYGISAFGLSTRLGISRTEAKSLIDTYFEQFPGIRQYMEDSIDVARQQGYVSTRMGRKRRLPDIVSKNPTVRGYAERNAINAPIQGFAADIIKKAMVEIAAQMRSRGLKSKMIMQVHDELNFQVETDELPAMQELVVGCMENAYQGKVRLIASCGVASNWLDAH